MTALSRAFALIGAALFAVAGGMLTWEVAGRYLFNAPTIWAAELSQLCLIWGVLLSMAWLLSVRRHIRVEAVTALLPREGRTACELLSLGAVLAFSGVVAWQGWLIFADSWQRGSLSGTILNLPKWVGEAAVPTGFALLGAQCLVELARVAREGAPAPTGHHE